VVEGAGVVLGWVSTVHQDTRAPIQQLCFLLHWHHSCEGPMHTPSLFPYPNKTIRSIQGGMAIFIKGKKMARLSELSSP
jgi:hypothetical protein